jgi:hypothetical protein
VGRFFVRLPAAYFWALGLAMIRLIRCILRATVLMGFVGCSPGSDDENTLDDAIARSTDEFNRRPIYRSLNPEILARIDDNDLELAVVDYVATKLEGRYEQEREITAAFPLGIRALWLTWVVEAEVNNGGFNQYYWNTDDRYAVEAVDAFRFFSAMEHASLMEEANRVRDLERCTIQKFRDRNTAEAFSESYKVSALGSLDERFYSLKENLSALRIARIRSTPELFSGN